MMGKNDIAAVNSNTFIVLVNKAGSYNIATTKSICSGGSYTFPDGSTQNNITSQVIQISHLYTVVNSYDSIITTTVNVNPVYNLTETKSVCSGGSYTFPDGTSQSNITAQVIHTSNLQTTLLCDSIITTTVNVNPGYDLTETKSVCSGGSYTFPDGTSQSNITAQVIHTSNLQTTLLCDSIITTTVNVNPVYNLTETKSVCSGGSYTFPDGTSQSNITAQVIHTSNLQTTLLCDSIITTTVNVNPVYNLTETKSVCSGGSHTFPDGTSQSNITAQVIHTSNLQTALLCDSIITTTVNVNPVYNLTETKSVCSGGSYTFPDGTSQSNITAQVIHTSNLQTTLLCDSIITTTVNVNPVYNLTETKSVCSGGSYTFPDGTSQSNITAQVIHTSNLQTTLLCDSIITTTVNVNPVYDLTETKSVCSGGSYTFPDGTSQSNITAQVIHTSNLQTTLLCDSIITTTVNVNPVYNLTETKSVCSGGSYTFPDGTSQSNITAQVIHTSNLQTTLLCDSIITTTVNVNPVYDLTETKSVCSGGSYTFPDGTSQSNITAQVIHTSNLQTTLLCDSIIVTTVNVVEIVTSVSATGLTLTADAMGASYQWLDCDNGYVEIIGEINQSFTPAINGNYAVQVTENGCIDTSSCISIINISIEPYPFVNNIYLYPNPTEGIFNVLFDKEYNEIHIVIKDITGKTTEEYNYVNAKNINCNIVGSPGLYFIEISTPMQRSVFKLMKQ